MFTLEDYYEASVDHRNAHKCGGFPYANGDFLTLLPAKISATRILEIGTAIGYSAYCLASKSENAEVTTIDMNGEHEELANAYWRELGVENKIEMIVGKSLDILPTLKGTFDLIFFDGFSPDPNEVKQYSKLISDKGVVITTNLSWSKTTSEYLTQIEKEGFSTTQYYDTAFSSMNTDSLSKCCEVWEEVIASMNQDS